MNHNQTDHHEAPANAGAYLCPNGTNPQGVAMTENSSRETIPDEHDEAICSGGITMCHECYSAGADCGTA